jgi:hypothetical protein
VGRDWDTGLGSPALLSVSCPSQRLLPTGWALGRLPGQEVPPVLGTSLAGKIDPRRVEAGGCTRLSFPQVGPLPNLQKGPWEGPTLLHPP